MGRTFVTKTARETEPCWTFRNGKHNERQSKPSFVQDCMSATEPTNVGGLCQDHTGQKMCFSLDRKLEGHPAVPSFSLEGSTG